MEQTNGVYLWERKHRILIGFTSYVFIKFYYFRSNIIQKVHVLDLDSIDAVFYSTHPPFKHKFQNMVIFRSENLYSLCGPVNGVYEGGIARIIANREQ